MKKTIIYTLLFSLLFLFIATACVKESDTCHRFIHFTNNSGNDVYYSVTYIDEIEEYNLTLSPGFLKVKKNTTEKLPNSVSGLSCYESYAENSGLIYLFLFDAKVAENTPWKTVREENLYLKKYALTIDELNERKWKITYSGE
jgi:hypothetical protein